ncbi:SpaA isopeptide-forming pilin-related protein [Gemmiger formicilis]|uniref:SpaA isopeptide-forming pilin-related protein n=1 Tax=Gemmiger formicilis TaxID=745368 RepID=UPI0024203B4E|nr:SpaA isopeptide-forming pilin-related protein [Gemmiger formicilis]
MTKAFSILHRAAALLVALCLLVGMALPVYAAEDEALFFDAGSETIPTVTTETTAEESTEPEQNPVVTDSETVPGKGNTPPAANEPEKETETTVQNTETVPNNDGKTQEAAENQTPAADTDTAPADSALTNKTPADTSDTAAAPNHAINTEETTAAKTNTEQDVLFADGDNPNEEDTMLADDLPDNDDANIPDTIADTSVSTGFIPATTTIYFEDNGRYDTYVADNPDKKCTIRFLAQNICSDNKTADVVKVMTLTEMTDNGHKIFSVTLNSADYPEGGFNRLAFQYYANNDWKEEIYAFGGTSNKTTRDHWTAIDLLAGKKFVRTGDERVDSSNHYNLDSSYKAAQWKRVEYYYKGMPLYFKNASSTDLNNVTAVFYKKGTDGTVETTTSLPIGTVEAGKFYTQKIPIPNNDSPFVRFTWDGGESALYNFSTDPCDNVPTFDLTKTNCFVYSADSTSPWQSAGSDLLKANKTIYFDATLSSYSYANDPDIHQSPMPDDGKPMYCFLTGSDGSTVKTVTMDKVTDSATPDRKLWSCKIPDDKTYTEVQFSAVDSTTTIAKDNKTKKYSTAEIPPTLQEPCFFADDGDPSAYTSSNDDVFREGYWGEKKSRHNAESGKNSTVVDIDNSGIFTQQKGTKYITSTLYDYYTDYELNGLNRDSAPIIGGSQRGFVTFEQFDRALSSAYTKNGNVKYPLYTGHFEPTGGASFAGVAGGMKLYGWGKPDGDPDQNALYNTFMAVNNSTYDDKGQQSGDYSRTFQGLVESKTSDGSANGLPLLRAKDSTTTNALVDPHFDEAFLQGKNSFNTVLGKVYKDVSFPFTKDAVFKSSTNPNDPEQYAEYWYYDSSKASLYLKQDKGDGKYYLESPIDGEGKPTTHANSKNTNASYGFFPFNQTVSTVGASQYNYGFGAKLQFDFTLTDDGQVVAGNDSNTKVPIKFFFSGDDDVWVYIDGKLVLDVGGAHGKASGLLEFGASSTVTPYVSSNKNTDTSDPMVYTTDAQNKTVYFNQTPITFTKTTKQAIQLNSELTTHTLTMFYMERGMWDSNMAVAFNFPDSNELQVEKEVNLTNVNDKFKPLFKDQKLFTFTLQNLATHYGTKTIDDNGTPKPVEVGDAFTASSSPTVHTTMEKGKVPLESGSEAYANQTVRWYAQGYDKGSEHRNLRYGTMELTDPLNIEKRDYLSFDVYAVGNTGDGVLSTNYLYLTLVDSNEKQMGCDANGTKSYLNTMLSGSVVMKNNQWVTVKLQLNKMPGYSDFDLTKLSKILIGDDYERTVYFRNFVFTAKPVVNKTVGFSVEQEDIPDYGSVETKTLMPASGAIFTSSVPGSDAQAVDTDGTFDLQDGETVTFTDQFRRGSYISLQETENTALYDTRWEVYENGTLVNAAGESSSVSGTTTFPLKDNGTKPEDGRTEAADNPPTGSKYDGNKPANAKTLVFRSYAAPEEEFPKLKVKFINTVKVGTLVIEKKQADDGSHLTGNYEFTVIFSNVGGIGLGGADGVTMTKTIPVDGSCTITGIPIGTRFQVVETLPTDGSSSLQGVTCTDTNAQYNVVDNGVRGTVTSENPDVTATFTNTAHQLMDITVEKQWQDADKPLTDNLPDAIWVKLERHHVDDTSGQWEAATDAVELKYDYMSKTWTHKFERLDKTDVTNGTKYEYRVAECATQDGTFTAEGTVTIDAYTYTASQNPLADGKITLINKRTDPNFALNLTKKGIDGENTPLLDGVEFKLEKLKDDNTAETTDTRTTGSDGTCSFTPLSPGKYRLTETKTAAGYTLLAEPIEFTLTAGGQCLRDGAAFGSKTTDADGVCNIALTIYNRKGFTLPHTGADAPSLWLLIGLPALVAVLLVLVFRYNKKGGKHS